MEKYNSARKQNLTSHNPCSLYNIALKKTLAECFMPHFKRIFAHRKYRLRKTFHTCKEAITV